MIKLDSFGGFGAPPKELLVVTAARGQHHDN
jgi:hypothetical protein